MGAAPHARQMLELIQHEGAHAAAVVVGMRRQLLHEERPHAALLEVAHVDPAVAAAGIRRALGVADDPVAHLEQELVDVLLAVHLDEAAFRQRPLVFDRLPIHVAEAELQELPRAIQVAAVDTTDRDLEVQWRRARGGSGA